MKHWVSRYLFRVKEWHQIAVILNVIDFYYVRRKEVLFGLKWDSGDKEYPGNKLILYFFGYCAYVKMPKLIKPFYEKHTFTTLSEEDAARRLATHGHLNYWEQFHRVFGFLVEKHGVHYSWGPSTMDSRTSKSGYCAFPWTEFDHVGDRHTGADGVAHSLAPRDYKKSSELRDSICRFVFLLRDYDGSEIRAYCYLEESFYRVGTGWIKKVFGPLRPKKVFRRLDISFDGETGPEKGSWKGGTTGTSQKCEKGDKFDAQYLIEKYCAGEHRSKSGKFKMSLVRREPDSPFNHEIYMAAVAKRKAKV